jgi:hypothetical protein
MESFVTCGNSHILEKNCKLLFGFLFPTWTSLSRHKAVFCSKHIAVKRNTNPVVRRCAAISHELSFFAHDHSRVVGTIYYKLQFFS